MSPFATSDSDTPSSFSRLTGSSRDATIFDGTNQSLTPCGVPGLIAFLDGCARQRAGTTQSRRAAWPPPTPQHVGGVSEAPLLLVFFYSTRVKRHMSLVINHQQQLVISR